MRAPGPNNWYRIGGTHHLATSPSALQMSAFDPADIRVALAGTFNTDGTCPLTPLEGGGQPWSIKWGCPFSGGFACRDHSDCTLRGECCRAGVCDRYRVFRAARPKTQRKAAENCPSPSPGSRAWHRSGSSAGQLHMWPRHNARHRVWSHTRKPRRTQSDNRKLHQARSRRIANGQSAKSTTRAVKQPKTTPKTAAPATGRKVASPTVAPRVVTPRGARTVTTSRLRGVPRAVPAALSFAARITQCGVAAIAYVMAAVGGRLSRSAAWAPSSLDRIRYYPYAYISAPEPYCEGLTEDGCQLIWQDVQTIEGDVISQCVAYCPWQ